MIRATLTGDVILLSGSHEDAAAVKMIPGASRTSKMPPLTWRMALTYDAIDELRKRRIPVNESLAARARSMLQARKYVDRMKAADHVEPLCDIPIKKEFTLYNHQVKAFNIALALFGYPVEGENNGK